MTAKIEQFSLAQNQNFHLGFGYVTSLGHSMITYATKTKNVDISQKRGASREKMLSAILS